MTAQNALLTILVEKIRNDSLVLPSLPEIALKIRKMADDPNVNLNQMADMISHDPALSARIMKVANSAFVGRGVHVNSLHQATTRIGLRYIKNVVTSMAMEQLFVSKTAFIKKQMDLVWAETLELTAFALTAMAQHNANFKNPALNFDTMTLAGLVHNIGALPILTEAEKQLDIFGDENFIKNSINNISGKIGATILRTWGFPNELIEVAEQWDVPGYQPTHPSYVDFIRIAAIKQNRFHGEGDMPQLLKPYVDIGLIPSTDFYRSPDFVVKFNDIKQLFA
ncbi:HDOD domain-containing protein [Rheinheimera sp.]|uniref:HDOD domain-containing protein n=1 Tax=Rheinheimera sp. TaxID=1869214 RepID=UPI0027BA846F|nr:HDOD domain-containing protein [Rheinheimera sp.]